MDEMRWLDGVFGPGMHDFIVTELELGPRVAHAIDEVDSSGWDALWDRIYEEYSEEKSKSG